MRQDTEATGTTTTIRVTKTFVSTVIMPPIDTAPAPAPEPVPEPAPEPAPAPPGTNQKTPQQPPQEQPPRQNLKGGHIMTTTVYITACGPAYSPEPVQGENPPSVQPAQPPPVQPAPTPTETPAQEHAPPAPPAQVAPTQAPSREAPPPSPPPPPPPANQAPPNNPPPADGPGGEGERGGGGRGGGGRGHGKGHDDDRRKEKTYEDVHPVTVGEDGELRDGGRERGRDREGGGGLVGILTRAADELLFG
ncbi:hypothetical protein ACJ73_09043 [Blastomyces percursus]|uniref:Uncharacterized protein n=1 Tax=Blastomyces percursus TaxID=1658174 RepID=A0A1J9PDS7_9EURO|nr:hypothetical protein ACJ73_09043 [Blastomyces percursus]